MSDDVSMILEAVQFAADKHGVQLRKEGLPYITHPITVANTLSNRGYGIEYIITGLFHDLLEDTDATYEEIASWCSYHIEDPSFQKTIPEAVDLLTTRGHKDQKYFQEIGNNKIAKIVKIVDRLHNLTTMKGLSKDWQKKYIEETWDYIIPLSEGTEFKSDLVNILHRRESMLE